MWKTRADQGCQGSSRQTLSSHPPTSLSNSQPSALLPCRSSPPASPLDQPINLSELLCLRPRLPSVQAHAFSATSPPTCPRARSSSKTTTSTSSRIGQEERNSICFVYRRVIYVSLLSGLLWSGREEVGEEMKGKKAKPRSSSSRPLLLLVLPSLRSSHTAESVQDLSSSEIPLRPYLTFLSLP